MIVVCLIAWLVFKRWWLGSLVAGLVAAAWVVPSLSHLNGTQRAQAFAALGLAFVMYAGITAVLYGLRAGLMALGRALRGRPESAAPQESANAQPGP